MIVSLQKPSQLQNDSSLTLHEDSRSDKNYRCDKNSASLHVHSAQICDTCYSADHRGIQSRGKSQKYKPYGSTLCDRRSSDDSSFSDKNNKHRHQWHRKHPVSECNGDGRHREQSSSFSRDVTHHRQCSDDRLAHRNHHCDWSVSQIRRQHHEYEYGHQLDDNDPEKHLQNCRRDKYNGHHQHSSSRSGSRDRRHRHERHRRHSSGRSGSHDRRRCHEQHRNCSQNRSRLQGHYSHR